MIIIRRKNPKKVEIESREDLLTYINTYFNLKYSWVGFRDEIVSYIDNLIKSEVKISHKKFYLNHFNKFKGIHNSAYQIGFWTDRGYDKKSAMLKIKNIQSSNGLKFSKKIKDNPEKYKSYNPTQIGYWIKKGYTKIDAKQKVTERQKTFSLESCIKKYGKIEGIRRFNKRQETWQKSRQKSLKNGDWDFKSLTHDDKTSFKYLKESYGDFWLSKHIDIIKDNKHVTNKYLKSLYELEKNKNDIESFIKNLSFDKLLYFNKLRIVNEMLPNNITPIDIWCNFNGIKHKNNKYGNQYWFNGHYLKSNGEFKIANFLDKNKIQFLSNKTYENSRLCYDFYLIKYNVYVELTGMKDKDYTLKKSELQKTAYKILWINNLYELKKFLNEKDNQK